MRDASATAHPEDRTSLDPIPRAGTAARRNHPLAREFARMLRDYRRRKGLSIKDAASRSGIDAADIERFESASHAPDVSELISLAAVYGVPAWVIMKRLQACAARLKEIDAAPVAS
jgi:ribosome-binding protein aMBF1 (putative translation factor)